jgi:hypothetical protein
MYGLLDQIVTTKKTPHFKPKVFNYIYNYVAIEIFFNFKLKLWQLPIKLTCLLYWYIVENIFQLGGHLPNISSINNVSKLNTQLCW